MFALFTRLPRHGKARFDRMVIQTKHVLERTVPFLKVCFSREGLGSRQGRTLIWGKARRIAFSLFPTYARRLQQKHGLTGGCSNCGASCNLLFRCPHWDSESRLCQVYDVRPNICRLFPITPQDIVDRNLVLKDTPCGFSFRSDRPGHNTEG